MNRRQFLTNAGRAIAGPLLLSGIARHAAGAPTRPNIILIVADDLGYGDLGVQGCKDIPSPNIDSIARNGVRFTNGYVSCPVCSPTRAGLATGRYQQRFGHEVNPGPADNSDPNFGLPLTETTLATRLKSLGYATGAFGKWHLGYAPQFHPMKRGFDEFFGFLGGSHSYVDALGDKANPIRRGTEPVDEKEYTTMAFTREALSFIDRHQRDPFFVYLPFNSVHAPLQGLESYLARYSSIQDQKRRTYAAMHTAMDDCIGRVLKMLRDTKIEENTLVFFISDNGGPTPTTSSRNDPLRGFKAQVLEGGIRIPFIMQWKGHLPAGKVYDLPVISLDIHPTAMAAVGGTIPADAKLDGVNLLPYLTGKSKNPPHDELFWRYGQQWAIRKGDWKLLSMAGGSPELYNLAKDIGEKNNLASAEPGKFKELEAAYASWNSQNIPPRWGTSRRTKGGARKGRKR
jgi:arylsulfatase A-like enzyme